MIGTAAHAAVSNRILPHIGCCSAARKQKQPRIQHLHVHTWTIGSHSDSAEYEIS